MATVLALETMESLPHTPASDMKKLGWRGVMKAVARSGKVVITNHNQPEAVILPVEEYARMLSLLRAAAARDEAALHALRRKFDERLACLNEPGSGAGDKLAAIFDKPFSFEGKIFTGDEF